MRRRTAVVETNTLSSTQEVNDKEGEVVVVGGGPAGLAASMMLAQKGWKNITVLEALSKDTLVDPCRSYSQQINSRGKRLLKMLNLNDKLEHLGYKLWLSKGFIFVNVDSSINFLGKSTSSFLQNSHMLLRLDIINILMEKLNNEFQNSINYLYNTKCVELQKENKKIKLTYQIDNQELKTVEPKLIIGCDGYNSIIRKQMQQFSGNKKFTLKTVPLSAGGARYKVLQLPLFFYYKDKQKEKQVINDCWYRFYGKSKDVNKQLVISIIYPSKTIIEKNIRLGVVTTYSEDHILWKLDTGDKILNYFEQEFPQLQIREMISPEQAENFAKNKGGTYSQGGYCENSAYYFPQENNNFQGVVLIGDSLHHFPPTFGQGVNAAFEDVVVLSEIFERNKNELKNSLEQYEKDRSVDTKALVEMQKNLPVGRFRFLLIFEVVFEQFQYFLHSKLPQVFPAPAATYIQDENLRYSQAKVLRAKVRKIYFGVLFVLLFAIGVGISYSVFRLVLQ